MKTQTFLLLLVSSFITINSAMAGPCPLKSNSSVIEAYSLKASGEMNCNYVSEVEDVITNIQQYSEDQIAINLFVRGVDNNASFDGGSIIEVPEQLVFTNKFGQRYPAFLVSNLATVAHEYGHALLEKKLEDELLEQFPKEVGFIKASKEISNLQIQIQENPDSKELINELKEKNSARIKNRDFIRFARLTTTYSELYADVVAAYQYLNKGAIFKALYYDEMNDQEFRMVQTRDFDTVFTDEHNVFMTEEHGYFAYTRNYIGKNLWPSDIDQKRSMLKQIGDAIVEEIRELLISGKNLPDYKEANQLLINRLKTK